MKRHIRAELFTGLIDRSASAITDNAMPPRDPDEDEEDEEEEDADDDVDEPPVVREPDED